MEVCQPRGELSATATSERTARGCELFVSHRGPAAKQKLVSHIVECLRRGKVQVFVDFSTAMGALAWETILANLRQAKAVLLVLTPGFEACCWCLEEARIMAERHESVLPIFYDRVPGCWSERDLKLSFEELCRKVPGTPADTMDLWRCALGCISGVPGWVHNSKKKRCAPQLLQAGC